MLLYREAGHKCTNILGLTQGICDDMVNILDVDVHFVNNVWKKLAVSFCYEGDLF